MFFNGTFIILVNADSFSLDTCLLVHFQMRLIFFLYAQHFALLFAFALYSVLAWSNQGGKNIRRQNFNFEDLFTLQYMGIAGIHVILLVMPNRSITPKTGFGCHSF